MCLFIGTVSCSDSFLEDKRDYNNMIPEDIYKDRKQANAVFATIYKQMLERYISPLCGSDPLLRQAQSSGGQQYVLTEEIPSGYAKSNIVGDGRFNGDNSKESKTGAFTANPPYWNGPKDNPGKYNDYRQYTLYPTIYLINDFIRSIDSSRSMIDDEVFWDRLKGQAIFARAWLFFDGIRVFGGIPYYNTEEDEPAAGDKSPRMPIQDCIDKICADFEKAAGLLPAQWDGDNEGRFTSVAAWAMISRVRVYAASPVFNASWDNTGSKRWEAALQASLKAEEEANGAGYGTSVTDIKSWNTAFYGYNNVFNPEAIIKVPKSNNTASGTFNQWEDLIRPGTVTSKSSGGIPAPEQMINLFPMKDGKRPTEANGYDNQKFYRNRDPRFYSTFAFSGCEWPGTKQQIWLYAYNYNGSTYRYTDGSKGDEGAGKKSRAIVWKMSDPNVLVGSESTGGTDILEYRYAEILLNIAECYAAKGDAGNCIRYLSQIRQRVGISSANNYGLGNLGDKYQLIESVLYERAVELAYEGKRSWDMRRWLLYEGGAGFDPRLAGIDADNKYDPELAWGTGWKLYNGQNGRPTYTKADNVLTRLGLPRFSGTKHIGRIWAYDLETPHSVPEVDHPLKDNAYLQAVPPITREMDEAERNEALDKLDAFYTHTGLETVNPFIVMGPRYEMDGGNSTKEQNFLFSWRGWYSVYSIHYDMYTPGKGNEWVTQTEGWMTANANPTGTTAEQDGTYVYCTVE